jgi:hypothetical protein
VEQLEPVQTAMTVRVQNGKLSVTDGPFAETKEQIGGFFLIDARDLNGAIQVASRFPSARFGSLEVRPVGRCEDSIMCWACLTTLVLMRQSRLVRSKGA